MDSCGTQSYGYDPANQLNDAEIGGATTSYIYNGDGVRTARETSMTYTEYVIDHNRSLPVILYDETAFYVWGLDLIARIVGSTQQYYHYDGLGSTRALTNGSGTTTATYNYDAFGAIKSQTGSGTNNFLFTGEWRDPETGFYFLRARYYDPVVGRFITRDPFTGFRADPQSLNRYTYAQNNPVRWNDPSGLSPFDPWLDGLQTLFDLAGLIPGLGEPIDLINAAIYLARGDQLNAALSAGAAIPFFGWAGTAGKFVNKAEKIQQLTQEAQKLYPKLANIEHKHHAQPIYLGGDPKGELSKINAAYHQLITNEFRSQWGYGRGLPSAAELKKIMQNVYDKFPLP